MFLFLKIFGSANKQCSQDREWVSRSGNNPRYQVGCIKCLDRHTLVKGGGGQEEATSPDTKLVVLYLYKLII